MSIVSLTVEADMKHRPERVRFGKQVYREFYPVWCTPRKLCCSPDNFDASVEPKGRFALLADVGSNTKHADVCKDGLLQQRFYSLEKSW